jgi:hypothetical protein
MRKVKKMPNNYIKNYQKRIEETLIPTSDFLMCEKCETVTKIYSYFLRVKFHIFIRQKVPIMHNTHNTWTCKTIIVDKSFTLCWCAAHYVILWLCRYIFLEILIANSYKIMCSEHESIKIFEVKSKMAGIFV